MAFREGTELYLGFAIIEFMNSGHSDASFNTNMIDILLNFLNP